MEKSWLIQRLKKPYEQKSNTVLDKLMSSNPFAFGGGLKNGGFSDEAMKLLSQVFRFDYMGSAEFEFGVVPETFQKLLKDKKHLIKNQFRVDYKYVDYPFGSKEKTTYKGTSTIYYICFKDQEEEIQKRIQKWASDDCWGETKEPIQLNLAMAKDFLDERRKSYYNDLCGWIELNNGFMFFTDEEMWKECSELFEIGKKKNIIRKILNK